MRVPATTRIARAVREIRRFVGSAPVSPDRGYQTGPAFAFGLEDRVASARGGVIINPDGSTFPAAHEWRPATVPGHARSAALPSVPDRADGTGRPSDGAVTLTSAAEP